MSQHTHPKLPCLCGADDAMLSAVIGCGPMCCAELVIAGKCPKHKAECEARELLAQDVGQVSNHPSVSP